ncbi:MAG: hypothetical protein AAF696_36310, partial [Bacteroidota bacterium]
MNKLKQNILLVFSLLLLSFLIIRSACKPVAQGEENIEGESLKNEVLVLGTIHSGHLKDSVYNLAFLDKLIREINPDYILAEIPPDRMEAAMEGFLRDDSISEPRVMRFPEYVDVVFPLTKELDFEIIPTAGWTKPMADERSQKLRAIGQNPDRVEDWQAYRSANALSDSVYQASGKVNDPYFIHTHTYDSIQVIGLQVYNRLFNVELGL